MTRTDPTPRELHPAGKGRGDLVIEAPGLDEVNVVPWPLLLRHKLVRKVEASDRYPWLVLSTALFEIGRAHV